MIALAISVRFVREESLAQATDCEYDAMDWLPGLAKIDCINTACAANSE
jgi:hypothetical protein